MCYHLYALSVNLSLNSQKAYHNRCFIALETEVSVSTTQSSKAKNPKLMDIYNFTYESQFISFETDPFIPKQDEIILPASVFFFCLLIGVCTPIINFPLVTAKYWLGHWWGQTRIWNQFYSPFIKESLVNNSGNVLLIVPAYFVGENE